MLAPSFEWCQTLPKVELHAHLSGSISDTRILELLTKHGNNETLLKQAEAVFDKPKRRSLRECFAVFPILHNLINSRYCLWDATKYVLEDYAAENCIYLELRTTPRMLEDSSSPLDYMLSVLQAIHAFHSRIPKPNMECRVLLSISRDAPVERAYEMVEVAKYLLNLPETHFAHDLLVGVEFSGNPRVGTWNQFEDVFASIRREFGRKLPISLHFAEIKNDDEADAMLTFHAQRLGHAVCMSDKTLGRLLDLKIPVEVCLSSNLMTESVTSLAEHPVWTYLHSQKHPYAICCDDRGIFDTSLSFEYHLAARCGKLTSVDLIQVTNRAVNISFAPPTLKNKLIAKIERFASDLNS